MLYSPGPGVYFLSPFESNSELILFYFLLNVVKDGGYFFFFNLFISGSAVFEY